MKTINSKDLVKVKYPPDYARTFCETMNLARLNENNVIPTH